jgi:hypothetical protein
VTTFLCPNCGNPLRADESPSGETIRCAACGAEAIVPADSPPESPGAGPLIPGYTILFEIGRTDKGVIYAARSRDLGRVVALEIMRGAARDRVRTEADAAARVQHPGVLRVYATGEHEGRAFVVREYCPDGSLEKKLAGTPLPPRDAAALVARLASAVQAAHDAKIIHHDLKPANILLAEDGTPRVAGLGRMVDPDDPSPSYLAPEQAAGKEAGPAADIYALGAILYECLTGRPPFRAATAEDTLAQVMSNHPVPPSQLNAAVPRELEAIAMKCLAKEPGSRFASAREMGDKLDRFTREPITPDASRTPSRAVGWVRRNPIAAALAALLVVTLVGGTAASVFFALAASAQVDRTRKAEQMAEGLVRQAEQSLSRKLADQNARATKENANKIKEAEQKALENEKLARAAEQKAAAATEELEAALARSLLRPLGNSPRFDRHGRNIALLAPIEVDALFQLAGLRSDRARLRVIEAALDDPQAAIAAARRPEWIIQSAVGLDRDRRKQAEALVLAGRSAKGPDLALARARLGLELNIRDPGWAKQSAGALAAAMSTTTDSTTLNSLAQSLNAVSERLERADSFPACSSAADVLTTAMSKATDPAALRDLALARAAVGDHLPARIAAEHARKAAMFLVAATKKATTPAAREALAEGLAAVNAHLNEAETTKVAQAIVDAGEGADPHNLALLAQGLKSAIAHLENEPAARYAGKMVDPFLAAVGKTTDPSALASLVLGLEAVSERLDAKEAASLAGSIVAKAGKTTDPQALKALAQALNAISARLDASRTAEHNKVADALVVAIGKAEPAGVASLAQGLKAISGRLDAKAAGVAAEAIAALLTKATDADMMTALAHALTAVAHRLDAKQAGALAASIVKGLVATRTPSEAHALTKGLSAISGRLDAADAETAAGKIVAILNEDTKAPLVDALAQGLKAVLPRLPDKQAANHAAKVAEVVVAILEKNPDSTALTSVGQALEAISGRLDTEAAAKGAAAVVGAMTKTTNANALSALTQALDVLNERMRNPIQAAKHANTAAEAILSALKQSARGEDLHPLAQALEVIIGRLSDRQASALAANATTAVIAAASKSSDAGTLYSAGQALKAVGKRLDAREANKAAEAVVAAMNRTTEVYALDSLSQALVAVSARLGSKEANKGLEALVVLLARTTDQGSQATLARALKEVGDSRHTGDLVAVLSHPFCAGAAQRALLDALGARCKREFANSRQFIDWVASNRRTLR